MELDRTAQVMLEDNDQTAIAEWWPARDAQPHQQLLLSELERHIESLRQLGSWMEAEPLVEVQASIRAIAAEDSPLATLEWQAGPSTGKPQGEVLKEACSLLLQLLTAQVVWALDHTHLLEMAYQMAITDSLTGLFNRRHFDQRLAEECLRAGRYGHPLSLIMLDIDHFKFYNDEYGHLEGDRILVQLAHLLEHSVRRTDTLARYGGDEFVMLLPETDAEGARVSAERVRRALRELVLSPSTRQPASLRDGNEELACARSQTRYRLTISAGVATCRLGRRSAVELVASADRALRRAKSTGRDCVCGPEVLAADSAPHRCQPVGGV